MAGKRDGSIFKACPHHFTRSSEKSFILHGSLVCHTFKLLTQRRYFTTWAWMMYRPSLTLADLTRMDELYSELKIHILHAFYGTPLDSFPCKVVSTPVTTAVLTPCINPLLELTQSPETYSDSIRLVAMVTSDEENVCVSDNRTHRLPRSTGITPAYQLDYEADEDMDEYEESSDEQNEEECAVGEDSIQSEGDDSEEEEEEENVLDNDKEQEERESDIPEIFRGTILPPRVRDLLRNVSVSHFLRYIFIFTV